MFSGSSLVHSSYAARWELRGVPLGHSRHLLFYDPSGLHLAILLMAFLALILFCFIFRGSFLPMKYKKIVEDRDPFFVDHWTQKAYTKAPPSYQQEYSAPSPQRAKSPPRQPANGASRTYI